MRAHNLIPSLVVAVAAAAVPAAGQPHFGSREAASGEVAVFIADLRGDGVELTAAVSTPLLGRDAREVRWPAAGAADALLVKRSGLLSAVGRPSAAATPTDQAEEWRLVRGSEGARRPGRRPSAAASGEAALAEAAQAPGWAGLLASDLDRNGRLTAEDPDFHALALFSDADADGLVDAGELQSLDEAGVIALVPPTEAAGAGAMERSDGSSTPLLRVVLAE